MPVKILGALPTLFQLILSGTLEGRDSRHATAEGRVEFFYYHNMPKSEFQRQGQTHPCLTPGSHTFCSTKLPQPHCKEMQLEPTPTLMSWVPLCSSVFVQRLRTRRDLSRSPGWPLCFRKGNYPPKENTEYRSPSTIGWRGKVAEHPQHPNM